MKYEEIENRLLNRGYSIREGDICTSGGEKLGIIKGSKVEIVYGEFSLPSHVEERVSLVDELEDFEIPYTEVLDREEISSLCGVIRGAKRDFKDLMITNARRLLSLAERVDSFEFK